MFSISLTLYGKETIIEENLTMLGVLDLVPKYDDGDFGQLTSWVHKAAGCERPMKYYWWAGADGDCIIYWKP